MCGKDETNGSKTIYIHFLYLSMCIYIYIYITHAFIYAPTYVLMCVSFQVISELNSFQGQIQPPLPPSTQTLHPSSEKALLICREAAVLDASYKGACLGLYSELVSSRRLCGATSANLGAHVGVLFFWLNGLHPIGAMILCCILTHVSAQQIARNCSFLSQLSLIFKVTHNPIQVMSPLFDCYWVLIFKPFGASGSFR